MISRIILHSKWKILRLLLNMKRSGRNTKRAVIAARLACNMTQKELAEKTGIRQSNISRIENGSASPTIDTLARIAAGLGKQLKIDFV